MGQTLTFHHCRVGRIDRRIDKILGLRPFEEAIMLIKARQLHERSPEGSNSCSTPWTYTEVQLGFIESKRDAGSECPVAAVTQLVRSLLHRYEQRL